MATNELLCQTICFKVNIRTHFQTALQIAGSSDGGVNKMEATDADTEEALAEFNFLVNDSSEATLDHRGVGDGENFYLFNCLGECMVCGNLCGNMSFNLMVESFSPDVRFEIRMFFLGKYLPLVPISCF